MRPPPLVFSMLLSAPLPHIASSSQRSATATATDTATVPPPLAFVGWLPARPIRRSTGASDVRVEAKKAKKTKKKAGGGGGASGGIKGFGPSAPAPSSSSSSGVEAKIDRSKTTMDFYSYLERNGAGSNLKRVALARFPLSEDGDVTIRGVVALRDIKKGDAIIDIPYELALNLGRESSDPTLPAVTLLREYCRSVSPSPAASGGGARKRDDGPYMAMLPKFLGSDCMGSTDFFPDDALDALQSPPVREETLRRRSMTAARFKSDVEPAVRIADDLYRWADGRPVTEEHLRWAVWLITSRVLTVQGEEGTGELYRLMIPLIDMCNHDRSSPHVLTGRAAPGGSLRVLAGRNVEAGEQVNICYGGGVAGNDRFVQDYGFLDTFDDGTAFNIVAKALSGRSRVRETGMGGKVSVREGGRLEALEALGQTTTEEDQAILAGGALSEAVRCAVEYRLGVKHALEKLGVAVGEPASG